MQAVAALTAAAVGLASLPARAQTGASAGIPMIRDAEIEQLLRDYTAPIFRVAGLTDQNIHVVIIDDKSFNAFVMDAHRIFINVGALTQATAPNQVIGVLAHETGHIVGGHSPHFTLQGREEIEHRRDLVREAEYRCNAKRSRR